MAIQLDRLLSELIAVDSDVAGICRLNIGADTSRWPTGTTTWHTKMLNLIRVDWNSEPNAQQESDADDAIQAHDGDMTVDERMDRLSLPLRLAAANARAILLIYQAMPVAIRPTLPSWVIATFTEAITAIQNEET